MMKIKISKRYDGLSDNGLYHFFTELGNRDDIEIVADNEFADIGIGIADNCGISILIDRNDPHAQLDIFSDVDKIVRPELIAYCDGYKPPSVRFKENRNPLTFADIENDYDIYCPVNAPSPYDTLPFKRTTLLPLPYSLPHSLYYRKFGIQDKPLDILFCGNHARRWYPYRARFREQAIRLTNVRVLSENTSAAIHRRRIKTQQGTRQDWDRQVKSYIRIMQMSKMMAFDGGVFGYALKKYFECMATGCLIIAPVPVNAAFLGLQDKETMVETTPETFKEIVEYYLHNQKEMQRITDNAYQLFRRRHTCKVSVDNFINAIIKIQNEKKNKK